MTCCCWYMLYSALYPYEHNTSNSQIASRNIVVSAISSENVQHYGTAAFKICHLCIMYVQTSFFSYCAKIFLCCSSSSCIFPFCIPNLDFIFSPGQSRFHFQNSHSTSDIWNLIQAMMVSIEPSLLSQIFQLELESCESKAVSSGNVKFSGAGRS